MDKIYLLKMLALVTTNETFSDEELWLIDDYLFHEGPLPDINKRDDTSIYTNATFPNYLMHFKERYVTHLQCKNAISMWAEHVKSVNKFKIWSRKITD